MKKEVTVKVTGYQTGDDGQKDTNEEMFEANYYLKDGIHFLSAKENAGAEGNPGTKDDPEPPTQRYRFDHRFLEVIKNSDVNTKLYFEAGKINETVYNTPYGRLNLTFETKQVMLSEEPDLIKVAVNYIIRNGKEIISTNKTVITVCERK